MVVVAKTQRSILQYIASVRFTFPSIMGQSQCILLNAEKLVFREKRSVFSILNAFVLKNEIPISGHAELVEIVQSRDFGEN